jgi:Flp pilus assembly pilin Flp
MLLALYTRAQSAWMGFRARFEDERGAVATEYVLLLALIALAIIGAVTALGIVLAGRFSDASSQLAP